MRPQDIVELGLELLGPDHGTVVVAAQDVLNLRWANSTLTTNGLTSSMVVHVAAHPEVPAAGTGRTEPSGAGTSGTGTSGTGTSGAGAPRSAGSASGVVSSREDLLALIERARAAARAGGPAVDEAPEIPAPRGDQSWAEPPEQVTPDELEPVTSFLGGLLHRAQPSDPDAAEYFGYAERSLVTTYLGTTSGQRRRHVQPAARFELCGKSHGRSRSAWAGRAGRSFEDLDLAGSATEVRTGLAAQATHIDIEPGRHRVVLSPSAAADLLVYLLWSAGARDAAEGRSAFSAPGGGTRVGQRLCGVPVSLRSDPGAPGLECADHVQSTVSSAVSSSFDAGLPLGPTDWVHDGVLQALLTTRHSAQLAGIANTPSIDNLIAGVEGATGSLSEVAARIGDGLLVTCLWYIREVDAQSLLLTGLTRDGVYVVRDGEVVGAAGNFRFNESPLAMLARIADAGTPVDCLPREWADWFTRTRVAPLVIDGFNLSTRSEAV